MSRSLPRIAVDAMGGDFGPEVVVPGAIQAVRDGVAAAVLVGKEPDIRKVLDRESTQGLDIEIQHASETVEMDEKPSEALRLKKDSSIRVAASLVKQGRCHGMISAGNSGATVAAGMFVLGRVRGVERPALAGLMPTEKKPIVLVDVGANVDSKPFHLAQFGIMGSVLAQDVLDRQSPKVGLLTIGEEEGKGNTVVRTAYEMLKKSSLNFVGNVEGRDIFTGEVDVVVCDGFVGNVALKLSEGLASSLTRMLKSELSGDIVSRMGAMLAMSAFKRFKRVIDSSEYGGAPVLGLKGSAMVCHGASNVRAITRAVEIAARFHENKVQDHLGEGLAANKDLASFGRQKPASDAA
jgi:glycerol-3-phosphate acyltransferase PlsX